MRFLGNLFVKRPNHCYTEDENIQRMVRAKRDGMISCERCGRTNREQRRYCASCGNQLGWCCSRCGFFNLQDESHCGGCGAIGAADPTEEAAKSVEKICPPKNSDPDGRTAEPGHPVASSIQPVKAPPPPASRQELIESVVHREIERLAQEPDTSDSTNAVSQDDIDKLFE